MTKEHKTTLGVARIMVAGNADEVQSVLDEAKEMIRVKWRSRHERSQNKSAEEYIVNGR
jgi:hypothetical protein